MVAGLAKPDELGSFIESGVDVTCRISSVLLKF